jgi:hypothetical protein
MAAMILSSPAPQFGQRCMSISKAQTAAGTLLYCHLAGLPIDQSWDHAGAPLP